MVDSYSRLGDSSAGGAGSNFSNLFPQGPLRQCIHEVPALLIRVTSRETESRDLTPARAQSALWEGKKARPTHDDDLGSGKVARHTRDGRLCCCVRGRRLQTRQKRVLRDLSATTAHRMSVCVRSGSDWIEGSILLNLTPVTRNWDADGKRSMSAEDLICLVRGCFLKGPN